LQSTLPQIPAIKPWYRVHQDGDQTIFHYADTAVILRGRAATTLIPRLLPVLDGRHSLTELERLAGEKAWPAVRAALDALAANDLLFDGPVPEENSPLARTAVFAAGAHAFGTPFADIAKNIETARVLVYGTSGVAREILRALNGSGVELAASLGSIGAVEERGDLIIAAPSNAELPALRELNRWALGCGQTWLQVLPYEGRFGAVGPLYVPWETACYECYLLRRASTVDYPQESVLLDDAKTQFDPAAAIDVTLAGIAVLNALRWLTVKDTMLAGSMFAFDPCSLERALTVHHVLRVPRCPACAIASQLAPPLPWYEV